ncbi:MAG: prolipoprotein diacylglyceryl transferase, partial [Phycisphaerae bacterium]|nr:prolipoprotein diacylglyceryl transferase [Phycisphaerae bacterium]
MRRVLFEIPLHINLSGIRIDGIPIFAYGAMLCLGFLAAIYITVWRTKRLGKNPEVIFNCALLAFAGGIIGSRGFYVLQHSHEFDNVWQMINIRGGGLTYFGGLLLATTFVIYYLR